MEAHEYEPDATAALARAAATGIDRLLIVGTEDLPFNGAAESRSHTPPEVPLPNGAYIFSAEGWVDLMVVTEGMAPAHPQRTTTPEGGAEHQLQRAARWFHHYWKHGDPISGSPAFAPTDAALIAGTDEFVTILAVHRENGRNSYDVRGRRGRRRVTEEGLTSLPHDEHDPATWVERPPVDAAEFARGLTVAKLANPLTDTIYSYQASKTIFRPYQFKPVLKLLNSANPRLLIADEVGLGKTIEAGLIWTELEARQKGLNRALVVCPAVLRHKWQNEMRRRFDRRLDVLDSRGVEQMADRLAAGEPDEKALGIVSLETLRNPRLLNRLNDANPRFDLIIVDEAHYLRNTSTRSHALGELLSEWAETLIFLSATPLNLGSNDLFNLLELLVPEEFEDPTLFVTQIEPNRFVNAAAAALHQPNADLTAIWAGLQQIHECRLGSNVTGQRQWQRVEELCTAGRRLSWQETAELKRLLQELNTLSNVLTRTRKVDVPDGKAVRSPHNVNVAWTTEEAHLYNAIRRWAVARAIANGGPPGFATQMPLRQAASCLPAAIELINDKEPLDLIEPDFDDLIGGAFIDDEAGDKSDLGQPLLSVAEAAAAARGIDSKFDGFAEFLSGELPSGEQVLLFSFFRRTLGYLHERLTALGYRCAVLHGGVTDMAEREAIMNRFRAGEFQILLCSEVGSEGLDFEFCHHLVNYDLPWNPMRVEQRIGRLDRFGQTSELIHILNFHVPGTIETDIFDRLYERIDVFRRSIGELEPILRDDFVEVGRLALDPTITDEAREARLREIEIAIAENERQLDDLKEASLYLAGIDRLLIDGFEEATTTRGRIVGAEELRNLIEGYFAAIDCGTLHPHQDDPNRAWIIGGPELGNQVSRLGSSSAGSIFTINELSARLNDSNDIEVTFSNEDASRTGTELISLRHPIVRAAVRHLAAHAAGTWRFSSLRVPGLPDPGHRYLTVLFLAETTGLRPTLELWPITLDLETGRFEEAAGFALLAAVARNDVADGVPADPELIASTLNSVLAEAGRLQFEREDQRRRENNDLVDARHETRRAALEGRIRRAEALLEAATDQRIRRLHQGRIRNLTQDLDLLPEEFDSKRALSLTVTPIAVAMTTGPKR